MTKIMWHKTAIHNEFLSTTATRITKGCTSLAGLVRLCVSAEAVGLETFLRRKRSTRTSRSGPWGRTGKKRRQEGEWASAVC